MHVCILYWNETECVHHYKSVYAFSLILIQNAYMHEQSTIGFGVRIWSRKYLNEYTPFSGVRQWVKKCYCFRPWLRRFIASSPIYGVMEQLWCDASQWLLMLVIVVMAIIPDLAIRTLRDTFSPAYRDLVTKKVSFCRIILIRTAVKWIVVNYIHWFELYYISRQCIIHVHCNYKHRNLLWQ